jgi:hypothetical protein
MLRKRATSATRSINRACRSPVNQRSMAGLPLMCCKVRTVGMVVTERA